MPADTQNQSQPTYSERAKKYYREQYDSWMPWVEDNFLKWFTKDNKASYATKDQLSKTKVTGVEQVDTLQDGVNNLVAGQVGKGGLAQPVGDVVSKEGINRAERKGKDERGGYGAGTVGDSITNAGKTAGQNASSAATGGVNKVSEGAKAAGGYVGGLMGGKK